jgi:hypothetical protein
MKINKYSKIKQTISNFVDGEEKFKSFPEKKFLERKSFEKVYFSFLNIFTTFHSRDLPSGANSIKTFLLFYELQI